MPPTLRPLISRHFPSRCMCLWGAEVLCVRSYKLAKTLSAAAAAPPVQLRGWLPCWGTESNWSLSPHTAQKLGNFSARCGAVRKSTPITQGQGAQLEHRRRQGLPGVAVGHVGSAELWDMGRPERLQCAPCSQQARNAWGNTRRSAEGSPPATQLSALFRLPAFRWISLSTVGRQTLPLCDSRPIGGSGNSNHLWLTTLYKAVENHLLAYCTNTYWKYIKYVEVIGTQLKCSEAKERKVTHHQSLPFHRDNLLAEICSIFLLK